MKFLRTFLIAVVASALACLPVSAQQYPTKVWSSQSPMTALGLCTQTSVSAAVTLGAGTCASFTGTASGTILTATSVSGLIEPGETVSGTGVPANTTIVSQQTATGGGAAGGAGTYVTSQVTTASSASLTTTGIPTAAVLAIVTVETNAARWRDDGTAPTASVGTLLPNTTASGPPYYAYFTSAVLGGIPLTSVQLIPVTSTMNVNVTFEGVR